MFRLIQNVIHAIHRSFDANIWRTIVISELPDILENKSIYIISSNGQNWFASLKCPCGCGMSINLNMERRNSPCWSALIHINGTLSLSPSVWRKVKCKSHFWIKKGRIIWV